MTAVVRSSLAAFAVLLLAACGGPSEREPVSETEVDEAEAQALGRDTDATVFDDMIQTQDRARAVEGVTLGRKDDLEQALEESAGNGSADDQ